MVIPVDPDLAADGPDGPSRRNRPDILAAIAVGGALGAAARYELSRLIHVAPGSFPWATFWTNITGSLALGFLVILAIERFPPSSYLRPFVATGFLGAYTTFSTYMVETDTFLRDGRAAIGISYLIVSALAGFAAVWVGILAGRLAARHR